MKWRNDTIDHRRAGFILLVGGAIALVAALTLLPVAIRQGWPMNHEFSLPWNFNSFYLRTLVYAEHMRQGDWLPIWSVTDNGGFGSPQPLMYHKLFYLVSGAFLAICGQMKLSILLSVWLFLLGGAAGLYRLCRTLGCNRYWSACGAILLLLANYTVTNWLVRGAMAEFAGAMLVPWVLTAFMRWLQAPDERPYARARLLALSLALLCLAHSVLAFYLGLLLTACFGCLVLLRRVSLRMLKAGPLACGALLFIVLVGPYMAAMRTIGADYDMQRILPAAFLPENQMKPLQSYLWDSAWVWGESWDRYTVQLDLPVLALFVAGLVLWGYSWVLAGIKQKKERQRRTLPVDLLALGIIMVLCIALQTRWAIPFYQHMPGAAFIQFPWRLLGILTPGLIALAMSLWMTIGQRLDATLASVASVLCVLASLALCGAWQPINYGNTPHENAVLQDFRFSAFGEYIPAAAGTDLRYSLESIQKSLVTQGCHLSQASDSGTESLQISYELNCVEPGTYPLPLFGSPLHQVWVSSKDNGTTRLGCAVDADSPTLCAVRLTAPGIYQIQVRIPTFWGWATGRF